MTDPVRVGAIVRECRKATGLPLTVKIRSGWTANDETFIEIARIAEGEGCDAVTLHPRARSQMFGGVAEWAQIARLKEAVAIPVIGSGDLFSAIDVSNMLDKTGCDGAMIARGAMGNPWIFAQALAALSGRKPVEPAPTERLSVIVRHLEAAVSSTSEKAAVREMRKHISWYVSGLPGAAHFRDSINRAANRQDLLELLGAFFSGLPI
jgi:nifR3 family TIM-barrel protein